MGPWPEMTPYEEDDGERADSHEPDWEDEFDRALGECGLTDEGVCMLAGTEHCDWECPFPVWRDRPRPRREKEPMELKTARALAEGLVAELREACEQIEIAGSIRRDKDPVKDIEIVARPKPRGRPEFGRPLQMLDPLEARLEQLVKAEKLMPAGKNGPRLKTFLVPAPGGGAIQLDLFIVRPPATWGVILALRTGPSEFSKWLVTKVDQGGACPMHMTVTDGALWCRGEVIPTNTEEAFFGALGERWRPPDRRQPAWRRRSTRA